MRLFDRFESGEQAVLVHIDFPDDSSKEDLHELQMLTSSAGVEALAVVTGSRQSPSIKYFVGSGKAEEIASAVQGSGAKVVIFNHSLTPSQERNLEKLCQCRVLDRTGLILDIFANNFNGKNHVKEWSKILNVHGVPKTFIKVKNYFLKPDFGSNLAAETANVKIADCEALDLLLWKWKGKLSREWYPFIFGLKHDLQIHKNLLTSERILKTQTAPLSKFLIKGEM